MAECAVVVTVIITVVVPLPAGIVPEGEKVAIAFAGTPDAVNVTALEVVLFAGTIIKPKFAGCPAVTGGAGVCKFRLKSSTVNVNAEVVPPPGVGFLTEMLSAPLWARSLASTAAFREVEFTNVVVREAPFTSTVELVLKFVPVTLSVAAGFPAGKLEGEMLPAPGTGLFTVKVVTTDGGPFGFATVTNGVPATAMALAGMVACNSVALTNADDTTLELNVTTELAVKKVPVSVSVKAEPPAVALAGTRPPTTGCVFVGRTASREFVDVPPPIPAGFVTEILIVP